MTRIERLQRTGIRRAGSPGTGFRYVRADGRRLTAADRARIAALVLPPAWTRVAISSSDRVCLQAVGMDVAGRWQYRYSPRHEHHRELRKYRRLVRFAEALPRMRRRVSADLRLAGLPREKVLAAVLRILATCFLRPGSEVYAHENGSYGLATLRKRHVAVHGDCVRFDFNGKSRQRQVRELRDRRVAAVVRRCLRIPGAQLFKYEHPDGQAVVIRRTAVNAYIKETMGERFSAKDFRTWAGTLICATALARAVAAEGVAATKSTRRRTAAAAVRETARTLGNTPTVCRGAYVAPLVFEEFERGRVLGDARLRGLRERERALIRMLRRAEGAGPRSPSARLPERTSEAPEPARAAASSATRLVAATMSRALRTRARHVRRR